MRSYPTIYLKKDSKIYQFEGERTIQNFVKFYETEHQNAKIIEIPGQLFIFFYAYWIYILAAAAIFAASSFIYLLYVLLCVKKKYIEAEKAAAEVELTKMKPESNKKED